MKILLVEDEIDLNKTLKKVLELSNYEVDSAFNGLEALEWIKKHEYDCIVMDIMMPYLDGISTLKRIREDNNQTPVLLLTAKSELEDKITGFDAGADDYLTKPFQIKELVVRIKALTKRSTRVIDISKFGNTTLDSNNYKISNNDKEIVLTRKEYQLLEYLVRNNDKYITSEKIFNDVWDSDTYAYITVLWVFISNLRKKLSSIDSNIVIDANRGKGYRILIK